MLNLYTFFSVKKWLTVVALWLMALTVVAQNSERYLQLADSVYYSLPDSSYTLCCCAEKAAREKKDVIQTAIARLCKARYLILKTRYEEASMDLSKAIITFKQKGDKNNLARAYNSKSILLERLGDDEGKYNYQNEAVRLYEETGNIEGEVKMLSNLSLSYTYDNRFKEAEECLDKILMMIDKLKQTDIYFYYQNRGIYYMYRDQFEKAIFNLEIAMGIAREKQMIDSEITALTRLAEANIEIKKYTAAQEQLNKAQQLALKNELDFEMDEIYSAFITLYTAQEKYKQAFETLTRQNQLREKINRLQSIHNINAQDKKEDLTAKLNDTVGALKRESRQLTEEVDQLKTRKWILTGASLVFLGLLLWSVYRIRKLKRKAKEQREVLERLYKREQ